MSSSIIEAKFQALDRTVRLLSRCKVASSGHLRELVYGQQQQQQRRKEATGDSTGAVPRPTSSSTTTYETAKRSTNSLLKKTARCQSGKQCDRSLGLGWIDPTMQRAQQILEDTWNEIEAAIQIDIRYQGPDREIRRQIFPSTLMQDHKANIPSESEDLVSTPADPATDPLDSLASDMEIPSQASSRNNSPRPERRTRKHCQRMRERPTSAACCDSADATNSKNVLRGSRARMPQAPCSEPQDPPRRLKNWFAPSSTNGNQLPPHRKRTAIIPEKQNQPSTSHCSVMEEIQSLSLRPSSVESLVSENATVMAQQHQQAESQSMSYPSRAKIDDPTFYYLEVRLEHPLSLAEWQFRVTFTDLSTPQRPSMEFDSLSVDHENCLLFPAKEQNNDSSRFFNPVASFAHVNQPRDLYDHWVHILVQSTHPIARVVIDTSVHFGLPEESKQEEESHDSLPQAAQEAQAAIHKPSKPRMTSYDRSDHRNRRAKSSIHARQQPTKPRAEEDPLDMSADEYKPWDATGSTSLSHEHDTLATSRDLSNHTPITELDSSVSNDAGISTIDKKKQQLNTLRSNMRKKLLEETDRLTKTQRTRF